MWLRQRGLERQEKQTFLQSPGGQDRKQWVNTIREREGSNLELRRNLLTVEDSSSVERVNLWMLHG